MPHAHRSPRRRLGPPAAPPRRRPRRVPAPEDDRGDRRVGAVGEAEHRDDPQVRRVGDGSTARRSIPVHPKYETVLGHQVLHVGRSTSPATSTSRSSSPAAPVDTFEEVLAAQGEVRGDLRGRLLARRARRARSSNGASSELVRSRRRAPARPEHEPQRVRGLPRPTSTARRSRSITQSGHQGRPVFQGQEIGIRLTHWAPTGNEVDLEFADFARYFADQPEVGVIACYIEGFKDGRTLMLAADHAAQLQQADRDGEGRHAPTAGSSMAQSHTGHLTGSDAVTSRGVPPVRRDARRRARRAARGLGRVRPHPARASRRRGRSSSGNPGVCVYAISGGTGAHMADMLADAGLALPDLTKATQTDAARRADPARTCACRNPVDCGGPPVADARGRKILDAILADQNVDIVVVPITGAVVIVQRAVHARHHRGRRRPPTKPIFVVWGAPAGHRRHVLQAPARRRAARCSARSTTASTARARRTPTTGRSRRATARRSRTRRPTPLARGEEGARAARAARARRGAVGVASRSSCSKAYGIKTSKDELCTSAAAGGEGGATRSATRS